MKLLIHAGTLIPATADGAVLHNQGILIEDGLIRAVDEWGQFSTDGADVIDAQPYSVMPGLIDAHTHVVHTGEPNEDWRTLTLTELTPTSTLKAARNAWKHVEMGVTTIRDVGAWDWIDIALRDAIRAGWQRGPRIVACGHGITSPGGHMDARKFTRPGIPQEAIASIGVVADGPDAARRAAWEQLARGADLIKINATLSEYVRASGGQCSPEMTREMMQAICEVAHSTGRKVAAHCHGGPGVGAAIEVGVDTFEHGRFLTDEMLDNIAAREKFLVPTLSPEAKRVVLNDLPTDPALALWNRQATEAMYATVAKAHARGVKVAAGTDAGMPHVVHGIVAFEMEHLAQADMSNADVIASATRVAAEALGLEKVIGQVRAEFVADLIAVDGDPLQELSVLQERDRIKLVLQSGKVAVDRR